MTEDIQENELSELQEQLVEQLPDMIKLFHMSTGQVIIATVEETKGDYAMVYRPNTVTRTYSPEGELLNIDLMPYLADIVDKDEIMALNLSHALTVTNPALELKQAYIGTCLIIEEDEEELTEEEYQDEVAERQLLQEEDKTAQLQKKKVYH